MFVRVCECVCMCVRCECMWYICCGVCVCVRVCVCVCEEKLPFASRNCVSPSHHPCKLPTLTTTQFQLQLTYCRCWEAACVCVCVCSGDWKQQERRDKTSTGRTAEVLRYKHFRMVRISCGRSTQNMSKTCQISQISWEEGGENSELKFCSGIRKI